ncbi:MAG: alanine-zipper protein [Rubrobacter sp.]
MDDQQQRINRAAQEFTEALVASYGATSDRAVVAQELGAQEIEHFFDAVIENLRAQAGDTSQMTRQLASQQQLAREATRDLARVSTDNYMDLLDSVFSFYQGGASRTQRRAEEAEARAKEAEARAEKAGRDRSEAQRQTEEAQRRVKDAEKSAKAAQRRAEEAESSAEEARGRTEQAEERAEQAERRTEEAERGRSEADSRGGDEDGDTKVDAVRQPPSAWVRTSGRSKVRGRNTRSRGGTFGRR